MCLFSPESLMASHFPKVEELRRRSRATSRTSPVTTRTSFPGLANLVVQSAYDVLFDTNELVLHERLWDAKFRNTRWL